MGTKLSRGIKVDLTRAQDGSRLQHTKGIVFIGKPSHYRAEDLFEDPEPLPSSLQMYAGKMWMTRYYSYSAHADQAAYLPYASALANSIRAIFPYVLLFVDETLFLDTLQPEESNSSPQPRQIEPSDLVSAKRIRSILNAALTVLDSDEEWACRQTYIVDPPTLLNLAELSSLDVKTLSGSPIWVSDYQSYNQQTLLTQCSHPFPWIGSALFNPSLFLPKGWSDENRPARTMILFAPCSNQPGDYEEQPNERDKEPLAVTYARRHFLSVSQGSSCYTPIDSETVFAGEIDGKQYLVPYIRDWLSMRQLISIALTRTKNEDDFEPFLCERLVVVDFNPESSRLDEILEEIQNACEHWNPNGVELLRPRNGKQFAEQTYWDKSLAPVCHAVRQAFLNVRKELDVDHQLQYLTSEIAITTEWLTDRMSRLGVAVCERPISVDDPCLCRLAQKKDQEANQEEQGPPCKRQKHQHPDLNPQ